jgi:hypothetical protein
VEEIGAVVYGFLEAGCAKGCQDAKVVVYSCRILLQVEHLLKLGEDEFVIVASERVSLVVSGGRGTGDGTHYS